MTGQLEIREGQVVDAIWSRWGDVFVYEGCPLLLAYREIYALSVSRRRKENQVPTRYSGDRRNHACCAKGRGIAESERIEVAGVEEGWY